jgi:hypothetical protein
MPVHPELTDLLLPILLSAMLAFVASFITWALLPFHHKEWRGHPDEAGFLASIRSLAPGNYMFPFCADHKKMKDPEFKAKMDAGPIGMLQIWAKRRPMPVCMGLSFLVNVMVSVLVAYLAAHTLLRGAAAGEVMRVAGTAGILAYTMGHLPQSIWFGKAPRSIALDVIDGIAFGLVTGAVFAFMWPAAKSILG